jgi:hypothetical protein
VLVAIHFTSRLEPIVLPVVKGVGALSERHAMKAYWGSGGIAPRILTSAQDGGEWSASRPGRFTPWERALGTHRIGGWVGPRAGLEN